MSGIFQHFTSSTKRTDLDCEIVSTLLAFWTPNFLSRRELLQTNLFDLRVDLSLFSTQTWISFSFAFHINVVQCLCQQLRLMTWRGSKDKSAAARRTLTSCQIIFQESTKLSIIPFHLKTILLTIHLSYVHCFYELSWEKLKNVATLYPSEG